MTGYVVEKEPVTQILYKLLLLVNLANEPEKGTAWPIDTLTFNPSLSVGDEIRIQNWKFGVTTKNQPFSSFSATVMKIQKVLYHHEAFNVEIILESTDREKISQLCDALRTTKAEKT